MAIIDGKKIAQETRAALKERVDELKAKGITPGLAVVLVGDDPASKTYVANKEKGCLEVGMKSFMYRLPAETQSEELEELIQVLNRSENVHGILIQLPLPKHLDEKKLLSLIDPKKDVDGFHPMNAGALMTGLSGLFPCTPSGVIRLIQSAGVEIEGKHAVVVGRSNIVGKPVALMLLQHNATVTVCHSKTRNLAEITRQADILVATVGKARFITADMVKPGAVVIDVGINRVDGKLCGDVDFDSVAPKAGYITPVPGGVGPMTITMLLWNTLEAAEQ